ncbi:MAG: family 16 glycosylhydrolase [Bacteroidales bacterium]
MNKISIAIYFLFLPIFLFSQDYKLIWEDNFDKPVLDEINHWTIEVNGDGGGNNEMQYYRRENISIEQHSSGVNCLVINAKRESFNGKLVTSGRLVTRGNVSCKYGKIEARIKLPSTANGLWPAFWMMGDDYSTVGWPRCGEIDILEMGNSGGINAGTQNRFMNGACHWGEVWTYYAKNSTAPYSVQDDFHLYSLVWDSTAVKMYLDLDKYPTNAPYYEMSLAGQDVAGNVAHYFHKPFSILFNLAVGGNFTGITGNDNISRITALPVDGTPAKMYVDYVRIYQKGDAGQEFHGPSNIVENVAPTAFTATKGAVTPNSVELLLNATDNSGSIVYEISYNGTTLLAKGVSGTQLSYVISGLSTSTTYNFSIIAKDASGNVAANNPIVVSATTGLDYKFATIDFETVGQDWAWNLFSNGDNSPSLYSVVANPNTTGINPSANCAKYIINASGSPWAGLFSSNIGPFTLTSDNCKVKVLVYKDVISYFDIKFENADASVVCEKKIQNKLINQWEELTLDYSSFLGKSFSKIVVFPDFPAARTAGSTNYWDNISFNSLNSSIANTKINTCSLYPNPVRDRLQINANQEIANVTIQNMVGQTLCRSTVKNNQYTLNVSDLPKGNYIVTVNFTNGRKQTQKITK